MVSNVLQAHTLVILLHHCRNQTALSSCEHLSSVNCHGIGLLALQDGEDDKSSGARPTRQNTAEDFLRVSFIQRFTIIIFRQSSTVGANWHSMTLTSPAMLLMLHVSHLDASVLPTAHHLMELDAETKVVPAEEDGMPQRLNISVSQRKK